MDKNKNNKDKKDSLSKFNDDNFKVVADTYSVYTSVEIKKDSSIQGDEKKEFPHVGRKEINSVKSFKPELQKDLNKLLNEIPKDQINRILNPSEEQKKRIFNKKGTNLSQLSESEKEIVINKMDSWKVSEEISDVNASVSISWVNDIVKKKDNKEKIT